MFVSKDLQSILEGLPSQGLSHNGELRMSLAGVRVWQIGDIVTIERVAEPGYWEVIPESAHDVVLMIVMNILGVK